MRLNNLMKYAALAALPIAFIGCGSGSCSSDGSGPTSLGTLPTGQSVMISSGNIPVNATKTGASVATLSVPGLASDQTVTFVMSNPQAIPSLLFVPKQNTAGVKSSLNNVNVSRCTVSAEAPDCTIISATNGANNGDYAANLVYEMINPSATGSLNPIRYNITGGSPTPPGPTPAGTIGMSLSADSLSIGGTITATYTLTGASEITSDIVVTATSSNNQVLKAYNDVNECTLSLTQPTCTITESGISAGSATISSNAGANYTIADSTTITVNSSPDPTPVAGTISMSLSAESLSIGGSITATYTLENSQSITTPITIIATSSDEDVLDSAAASCDVTTTNPTCTITESGISAGTATISSNAGANYTIADSTTITVKPPIGYAYITNAATVSRCYVDDTFNLYNCIDTGSNFMSPSGIAVSSGPNNYAYITNSNDEVTQCSINPDDGLLQNCNKVTITNGEDPAGTLSGITIYDNKAYITDLVANSVYLCDIDPQNGNISSNCPATGAPTGLFNQPSGISISSAYAGTAYISNLGGTATLCSVLGGGPLGKCQPAPQVQNMLGVSISPENYAYFTSPTGILACALNSPFGSITSCTTTGNISSPTGIYSVASFVYVTDTTANSVSRCTADPLTGALSNCEATGSGFRSPSALTMKPRI